MMPDVTIKALRSAIEEAITNLKQAPFPAYGGRRCVSIEHAELDYSCCQVRYWYNTQVHKGILSDIDTSVINAVDTLEHAKRLLDELEHNVP